MTINLDKLNKEVQTRFELLTQADMVQLDELTARAKAEGKIEQRQSIEAVVRKYTQDIVNGDWQLNPQPIIITTEGWLLDGWHRVKSGIRSGQSVVYNVTRNWPTHSTFKVVDTGKGRSVAQLLMMQGKSYVTRKVGCINAIIQIANNGLGRRAVSIHEVERIEHLFEKSMATILELRSHAPSIGFPAPIVGSIVFIHDKLGEPIRDFAEDLFTLRFGGEGNPARALKRWIDNNTSKDIRLSAVRCTMNALMAYVEKQPMTKMHNSQTGLEWARKLQAKKIEEVKAVIGLR